MIWQIFARSAFLRFWNLETDDALAAILRFFFSLGHSHGRSFCSIIFKLKHKIESCLPLFAILKSARLVGNFRQYGGPRFRKNSKWRQKTFFGNKASGVSMSTNIDLLITNWIIFSRLVASSPNKMAEMSKQNVNILKNVEWLNRLTLSWAILFLLKNQ